MKRPDRLAMLGIGTIIVVFASLAVGPRDGLALPDVWQAIFQGGGATARRILWEVRLPRVLLAFLVGAGLSGSGLALQVLARNPLVSPDILGLSNGAAFGAALAMSVPFLPVQPTALVFALLATALTYAFARDRRGVPPLALVLAGVTVAGMFTAALAIVQMLSNPFRLQSIVHWTMGNLHNASWSQLAVGAPPIVVGIAWLYLFRWRLNVLCLGDDEARAVGLDPRREKLWIILPSAMVAASAVAMAGVVAMIGLVIPHAARFLFGEDNTRALPASLLLGGSFLVVMDDLARASTSFEVPIGVFTLILGGPIFLVILRSFLAKGAR